MHRRIAIIMLLLAGSLARASELQRAFETIKDFDFWTHNDPWAHAILTMIDSGRDGVPVLVKELRDTDSARLQRTIPIALREIGDRRAIPFLIHALARCRPDTGNNGFSIPDGELFWRVRPILNPHGGEREYIISDNRPEQVMVDALEALCGRKELDPMYWWFGEDGEWPKEWNEATHERKRQVARRIADRWWTWWEANKQSLLTAEELAWVQANAPAKYQTPPAESDRSITIRARDDAGSVTEFAVEIWADRERYSVKPDADGVVTFKLPKDAERVSVVAHREGSVPLVRLWGKEHKPPLEHEIGFTKAVETSGVVTNADGEPVVGASIFLIAPKTIGENEWADVAFREVHTDDHGRWKAAQLPASVKKLKVYVAHERHQTLSKSTNAKPLLDGTHKIELKSVFDITGVVTAADGKPVSGAKVLAIGEPYYEHEYLPVLSDAQGRFTIARVAAAKLTVAVQARDAAPWFGEFTVDAKKGLEPLKVQLSEGRTINGKVIDAKGKPVAGVIAALGTLLFDLHARTDESGAFTLRHVPEANVQLEFFRSGYVTEVAEATASNNNIEMTLQPVFRVSGSVTDARTGKPIDEFTYVQGILGNDGRQRTLWRNYQQHFTGGKFERVFPASHDPREREQETTQWYARIEADEYTPQETRIFDQSEGPQVFDFALEPGESIGGTVIGADGKPVNGAIVLLATATQSAEVYDGRLSKGGGPDRSLHVKTDDQGRFTHRPQNEPFELIAIHDSGYARLRGEDFKGEMKLGAWGRIEGTVVRNGKPVPEAQMTLSVEGYWSDTSGDPRVQLFTSLDADKSGAFKFERVMAGRYRLSARHEQQGSMGFSGPGFPFEIAAGQTRRLDFGGDAQRTVIGRLSFAKAQPAIDWSIAKLILSPHEDDRKQTTQPVESIVVPVSKDGSFRIENMKSGAWQLMLDELKLEPYPSDSSKRQRTARGGTAFELPSGHDDSPLDLGEVVITVTREPLKTGMPAPPIDAITLGGQPFQLADYAGKFVLLDFWATWCGPCLRETPHLKAVRDATRSDPRFVMIGLSLDSTPSRPLAYTKAKGMDWTQAFLGTWGKHPATEDYGVDGIPQIILIGPDGNVIAADLRGDGILKAVQEALAKAP